MSKAGHLTNTGQYEARNNCESNIAHLLICVLIVSRFMAGKLGIYEFNLMSLHVQAATLWDNGTFLANRIDGNFRFNLYSLSDFYVEVEYLTNENEIIEFRSFKRGQRLEPYLDQIDVRWLL